jgi:mono/diheme cytochrome c family protein
MHEKTSRRGPALPRAAWWAAVATAVLSLHPLAAAAEIDSGFGDPIRGQVLFSSRGCVGCHAVRGAGGRIGPDLGRTTKGSFYEIFAGMWNHSLAMGEKVAEYRMVRPTFEEGELADLISFIYFLNYFDEPGDPRTGEILFASKHCIQCHRLSGEGGSAGPALDTLPRGVSPLRIARDLWNHGPAMVRAIRRRGLDVPQFDDTEIIDLFAYLRSRGERRTARRFQSPGDPARGERLFESKGCLRCHEVFGGESIGPDLGTLELGGSVTQIAGRMWNHWPAMAEAMEALDMPVPEFGEDELADLFAYLFIARYEAQTGDTQRGRAVYIDKRCSDCHGLGEKMTEETDDPLGPALAPITGHQSKENIVEKMWNHVPKMSRRMGQQRIPWPRFEAQELADILAFLSAGWEDEAARPAAAAGGAK